MDAATRKLIKSGWTNLIHNVECGCDPLSKIEEIRTILAERELRVLTLRFGLEDGKEQTLTAVGREFGHTRERIRQIEAKAIHKLQEKLAEKAESN